MATCFKRMPLSRKSEHAFSSFSHNFRFENVLSSQELLYKFVVWFQVGPNIIEQCGRCIYSGSRAKYGPENQRQSGDHFLLNNTLFHFTCANTWTRWGLRPGPSACEAEVKPLHRKTLMTCPWHVITLMQQRHLSVCGDSARKYLRLTHTIMLWRAICFHPVEAHSHNFVLRLLNFRHAVDSDSFPRNDKGSPADLISHRFVVLWLQLRLQRAMTRDFQNGACSERRLQSRIPENAFVIQC